MPDYIVRQEGPKNVFDNIQVSTKQRGQEFVAAFFALWKSMLMHSADNEAVLINTQKLNEILEIFLKANIEISLTFNGIDLLFNGHRLKKRRRGEEYVERVASLFTALYLGEILIPATTTHRDFSKDFTLFCHIARKFPVDVLGRKETFETLEKELVANGSHLVVRIYDPIEDQLPPIIDKPQLTRQIYKYMILDYPFFQEKIQLKEALPIKKVLRHVQNLIDLFQDQSADNQWNHLMLLASLNSYQESIIGTHAVNTTFLSLAIGVSLGIERSFLKTLGLISYFHDIAIPEKKMSLPPIEEEHTELGFAYLSRLNSLNFPMIETALIARSHHQGYDSYGNLMPAGPTSSTPLGEILKVADYYDTITRWWPRYRKKPLSRLMAVKTIFDCAEKGVFLPSAAMALLSSVGIYPHGSLLKVKNQPFFAVSLGGFYSYLEPSSVAILNEALQYCEEKPLAPDQLCDITPTHYLRISPLTYQNIFKQFEISRQEITKRI